MASEIRELERTIPFETNDVAEPGLAFSVLRWIGAAGQQAPTYWSMARDMWLRNFYLRSDYIKIAVSTFVQKAYAVPLTISPRDRSVKAHVALAQQMSFDIMYNSGLLKGFQVEFAKFATDYATQDNGAFMMVMGPGKADGPIRGQAVGVMHLDSQHCVRTGNVEFPVIYEHTDGRRYKLHYTRIIFMSSMPSGDAELFDVGLCGTSRCIDAAQNLLDITTYEAEKLGSRPPRQILYAETGATLRQIQDAVRLASVQMDAQGLDKFSRTMLLAPASATGELRLNQIDLAKVPDGFDREKAVIIDISVIAAAYGLDTRDLAHSFGITGQTKADAEVQDRKRRGKGIEQFLNDFAWQLDQKFLPETLVATFDYVDDTQDEQAAAIRKARAEGRQIDLTTETITVRVAREQMLEDGEITEQQFEDMELAEGRLADGLDVLMLFMSQDSEISAILSGIVDNPLATEAPTPDANGQAQPDTGILDTINERILLAWQRHDSAPNANIKRKMRQCLAALEALKKKQEPPPMPPQPPQIDGEQPPMMQPAMNGKPPVVKMFHTKQDEDLDELMTEYDQEFTALVEAANNGETGKKKFQDELEALVAALLLAAFLRGSRLSEDELTDTIQERLGVEIQVNIDAVSGFADDIYEGRYQPEELGEEGASNRVALWVGALAGIYALGQMHRADNPHYRWVYGPTDHCSDCQRLNGQVHTAEEWLTSSYYPRARSLACGGYRCRCVFEDASGPSRGGF